MLNKSSFRYIALAILATQVIGREFLLERDNRPVYLYPRRFGQEQPAVLQKLRDACPGQVCGTLAGQAVSPLLAAQGECTQQDMADAIIDASKQFDAATQANMVAIAVEYRQVEKNTPPDFTTNPPSLRNSVFCQKAPKNAQLNGLVQAQDPANDPNLFFDPATQATVKKGAQPNTLPFGGAAMAQPTLTCNDVPVTSTVTVVVSSVTTPTPTAVAGANFGSCSIPQIEFGVGFDGRKETSFQPTNKTSFNHGSAQNIGIITQFVCDTLTNSCKANQAAKDTCKTAQTAAAAAAAGTGAQADAFNSVFGVQTQFVNVAAVDNQGNIIAGTGNSAASPTAAAPADFGSCSVPQIEFGVGFDGRRETSFQPVDKQSYNHGSAQNIGIITQFICDTLTNSCKANQPAKDICAKAQTAASTAAAKTGAQADAFNAVFGIKTNFTNVSAVDDQGNVIAGTGNPAASPTAAAPADFGSCTVPQIEFGVGFDGRKETSFQPTDKQSFNHGSAQNIGIITQFICDTLTNSCKANQSAKDICAKAQTAATAAAAKTGAQADAFNLVFGIKSQFASVPGVDDQGRVIAGTGQSA